MPKMKVCTRWEVVSRGVTTVLFSQYGHPILVTNAIGGVKSFRFALLQ